MGRLSMSCPEIEYSILIIGIGSLIRGDDAVGRLAAIRLADLLRFDGILIMDCHQILPEHSELLSRAQHAFFIDASVNVPPGEIVVEGIEPSTNTDAGPHDLDPAGALGWSLRLYGRSPKAVLYAVGPQSMEISEKLTETVEKALEILVFRIVADVKSALNC
jgi:hydrogenase maturation protease